MKIWLQDLIVRELLIYIDKKEEYNKNRTKLIKKEKKKVLDMMNPLHDKNHISNFQFNNYTHYVFYDIIVCWSQFDCGFMFIGKVCFQI